MGSRDPSNSDRVVETDECSEDKIGKKEGSKNRSKSDREESYADTQVAQQQKIFILKPISEISDNDLKDAGRHKPEIR